MSSLIPQQPQPPRPPENYAPAAGTAAPAVPSLAAQLPKIALREIVNAALRWCWIPMICVFLGAIGMLAYATTQPKMYASYGTLNIKTRAPQVFDDNPLAEEESNNLEQMKTVEQGLLSSTVLLRVAEKNDLVSDPIFIAGGIEPQRILNTLGKRVGVDLRKGTRLMDIIVEDTDPVRAAKMVEDIVEEYETWKDGKQSELIEKTTAQLVEQELRLRKKMEESEERLQKFRSENSVLGLTGAQDPSLSSKLETLNKELSAATNEKLRLQAQFRAMAAKPEGEAGIDLAARGKRSELTLALESRIAIKKAEFAKIKERYRFKHPVYIDLQSELGRLEESLAQVQDEAADGLANDLAVARSREQELQTLVANAKTDAMSDENSREKFSLLTRDVEIDRSLHTKVALQLQETKIGAAFNNSFLGWYERPLVPVDAKTPRKLTYLILGAFLGGSIGCVLALLLTLLDPRVREARAVERKLCLPLLAKLPVYTRQVVSDLSVAGDGVATLNRPAHLARYTTAAIDQKEKMQTLLFASPFDGDGKTLCVMKCARTMVKQGYRTLVIDADFRDQGLSRAYSSERQTRHGLAAYLMGEAEAAEVLFETGLPGLWFLPTGATEGDSGDLLAGPALRRFLDAIEPMFDRVIFDMSSVLECDDVQAVARHLGATYLVAQKGKGAYRDLIETSEVLQSCGGNLTGFIWNEGGRRRRKTDRGPVIEPVSYPAEVREVSPRGQNEPMPAPNGAYRAG